MSIESFSPLAYIAQTLVAKDSAPESPPRWCYLSEETRKEYLARAERLVDTWAIEELTAVIREPELL